MNKTYLLTPGPTPIPETVLAVLSQPIIHHRTPEFETLFKDVQTGLKYLFQTSQEVILLAATGSGAMDATVSNLFSPEDSVIVLNAGKFGERWTKIAKVYGLQVFELQVAAGSTVRPEQVRQLVEKHPEAKAILFQACETSTGVQLPTREICEIASQAKMLSVCDAITACGVIELPMDAWGIDVLLTGSQKALMLPPGLSMIALSQKAWALSESSKLPHFYFDLKKERKAVAKNQTSWTPAISLIMGLKESLRIIQAEGLPQLFKRHDLLARATRAAVQALGLETLGGSASSTSVTAVKVPATIADGKKIPKTMRSKYGVVIAGGQDELEGKIFRLSHFGYCGPFDVVTGISALELTLKELGHPVELGRGVGAVLKTISEG
jgi:aspartate aminotransferase-like enzyme